MQRFDTILELCMSGAFLNVTPPRRSLAAPQKPNRTHGAHSVCDTYAQKRKITCTFMQALHTYICNKTNGQKVQEKNRGQRELYSRHNDASGTKDMSKPCLKRWHRSENAYTKNFSRLAMRIQWSQSIPHVRVHVHGPPPPLERRNMPPLGNGHPLPLKETGCSPLIWGGGGQMVCFTLRMPECCQFSI